MPRPWQDETSKLKESSEDFHGLKVNARDPMVGSMVLIETMINQMIKIIQKMVIQWLMVIQW